MNTLASARLDRTPPAVVTMLAYTSRLLLTETSSAPAHRETAHPARAALARRATAVTITLKKIEGYMNYGIND